MAALVMGKISEFKDGLTTDQIRLLERCKAGKIVDFIAFADSVTRKFDSFETKGVIAGEPQRELYRFLTERCSILARGGFRGERGTSSSTLVGCKGLGKTTAFTNFVKLAPLFFENVIPIFITCEDMVSTGLTDMSFLDVVRHGFENELHWKVRKEKRFLELSTTPLVECLNAENKYLLLIIDELDMWYQGDPDRFPSITRAISELSGIGNLPSGRISCILSGSSSMLEHLIRTNILPGMSEEFRGLKGAVNLNESKFVTRRISSSSPLDMGSVRVIAATMEGVYDEDWIKMVTFAAGANPREIQRILAKTDPLDLLQMDADMNYSGQNSLKIPVIGTFLKEVLKKLVEINLHTVIMPIAGDLKNVQSIDWITKFKPLTFATCREVWDAIVNDSPYDVMYAIFYLADRGWINAHGVENGYPKHIFPSSTLKLVRYHMVLNDFEEDGMKQYFSSIISMLQNGLDRVRGHKGVQNASAKIADVVVIKATDKLVNYVASIPTESKNKEVDLVSKL